MMPNSDYKGYYNHARQVPDNRQNRNLPHWSIIKGSGKEMLRLYPSGRISADD